MDKYRLTIFRQNRIILIVFLLPISLLTSLLIGLQINILPFSIIVPILFFGLVGIILFYFSIGNLTVLINDRQLNFVWDSKKLFNYKNIQPVEIDKIRALVIDQGEILRKIRTNDREIVINNGKIFKKDSQELIEFLLSETQKNNVQVIDSWDVWKEKGLLSVAYKINTVILVVSILIIVVFIAIKGFNNYLLLFMPLSLSQLLLYHGQMKEKMKKTGGNNGEHS